MKNRFIIDAGALALYFAGDERVKKYFDDILAGKSEGYILEINLAEFFYKTAEILGLETAEVRYRMIRNSDLKQISASKEVTREAAILKLRNKNKLSLADSFLIAEAKMLKAIILTTDKTVKEIAKNQAIYFKIGEIKNVERG